MVVERITDGTRIAELLASEIDGREDPPLDCLSVENADPDATGSVDGTFAYEIHRRGERVGDAYVHDDRVRVEVAVGVDAALDAARDVGIRARPKAVDPPRTILFVESGAETKRAVDALVAAVRAD